MSAIPRTVPAVSIDRRAEAIPILQHQNIAHLHSANSQYYFCTAGTEVTFTPPQVMGSGSYFQFVGWHAHLLNLKALQIQNINYDVYSSFEFHRLAAEWKKASIGLSSITAIAMIPAYQKIIGMGIKAVPLILAELWAEGDQPSMWFWALKAITDDDPVRDEDRGDMVAMAKAWLEWGRANSVS